MIPTTLRYKENVYKGLRGATSIRIEYGIKDESKILKSTSSPNTTINAISTNNLQNMVNNPTSTTYAMLCRDFFRTDGSMKIPTKSLDEGQKTQNGYIINKLSEDNGTYNVTLSFNLTNSDDPTPKKFNGIVISFDEVTNTYPTKLVVVMYDEHYTPLKSREYINRNTVFSLEDELDNVSIVEVQIKAINKGKCYLRVSNVMLGLQKIYTEKELVTNAFDFSRSIDLLSNELSRSQLTFTVENYDKDYNPFHLTGIYKKFNKMQPVTFKLGLELDNDTIEWMTVAKLYTDSFKFEKNNYSITCIDLLSTLEKEYFMGVNQTEAINLTWEQAILEMIKHSEGELSESDFNFSDEIKKNKCTTSLKKLPMNQCLQLIANINNNIVYTDRNGIITFKSAWIPKVKFEDNGHERFSSVANAYNINQLPLVSYYQLTKDYALTQSDSYQRIQPREIEYLGYVSNKISKSNGTFNTNPLITIDYSLPTNISNFYCVFDHLNQEFAKDLDVRYYNENTLVKELNIRNNTSFEINQEIDNVIVTRFTIEIIKWNKGLRRAVINRLGEGLFEDYYLSFGEITSYPSITKKDYTKDISVSYHEYKKKLNDKQDPVLDEIIKTKVKGDKNGQGKTVEEKYHVVIFDNEYDGITIEKVGGTGTIVDKVLNLGSAALFTTSGNTGEMEVKISGYALEDTTFNVVNTYNTKGVSQTLDNPLCTNNVLAKRIGDWYYDYIKKGQTLSLDYRGDIALEPYDFIYLETQYQDRLPVVITKIMLKGNNGLKGSIEVINV